MDRLSIFVAMMTWSVVSGCLIVLFLSLGYVGWVPIVTGVVAGFALGLPLAKWIGARIKRQDPAWDEVRNRPAPQTNAEANAPNSGPRSRG
jgi:hypothetical protein